ncbi:uncharacterized protein LOC127740487 [Arachis duranensis]|uniref:Uncharacterized protein LOC127740487 n=1 Tax=Arachis duranensis TaxID=130453 RepID=A0A9C6T095_ARADU|nr:uncharacterized protein LOC127740487 [Arachis duranensis]
MVLGENVKRCHNSFSLVLFLIFSGFSFLIRLIPSLILGYTQLNTKCKLLRHDLDKLKSHQEAGDTPEKAFTAVFGKEQPGRVRCYGRTSTKTSLQKEREIAKIKQQHTETISSMKTELHETKDRVQSLEDLVKLLLQQSSLGTDIDEALSLLRAKESTHDINSKQCSNGNDRPSSSTRDPK